jgi:uncharacterized membrane protein YkgB
MNDKFNNSNETEKNSNELLDDESTKPKDDQSKELKRGIGIFIGINIFMLILNQIYAGTDISVTIGFVAMLVNIFLLVYFSKYRKDVAGGMLTAFAILIVLTFIVAPIFWVSVCAINDIAGY